MKSRIIEVKSRMGNANGKVKIGTIPKKKQLEQLAGKG